MNNTNIINKPKNTDDKTNLIDENNTFKDNIITINTINANSVKNTIDSILFSNYKSNTKKVDNNLNTFIDHTFRGNEDDNRENAGNKIETDNICTNNQLIKSNNINNDCNKKSIRTSLNQNFNTNIDTNNNESLSDINKILYRNSLKIGTHIYGNLSNEANTYLNSHNNSKYKNKDIKLACKSTNNIIRHKRNNIQGDYYSYYNTYNCNKKVTDKNVIGFNSENDKSDYITPKKNKLLCYYH